MLRWAIAISLLTLLPARDVTACIVPTLGHAEGNSAEWERRAELLLGSPAEIQLYVQTIREQPFEARTAVLMLRMNGYRAAGVASEIMGMCDSLQTQLRCIREGQAGRLEPSVVKVQGLSKRSVTWLRPKGF